MNDTDLTDLIEHIASDYWDSRVVLDGRDPWSEQTVATRNQLKEAILPWIFRAAPLLIQQADKAIRYQINMAREAGLADTEIIDLLLSEPDNA